MSVEPRRSLAARVLLLVAIAVACRGAEAWGSESAVLNGVVADSEGRPLAGARVSISGNGVGNASTLTRDDGSYRFPALRPFTSYRLTAARRGLRTVEYDGMRLEAGRARVINFRLKRPGEREVVILVSRDPFPYEDLVRGFSRTLRVPTRVIDLDAEADPSESVRRAAAEKPNLILGAGLRAARLIRSEVRDVPSILTLVNDPRLYDLRATNLCFLATNPAPEDLLRQVTALLPGASRVGLVYDATVSQLLARDLREAAGGRGLRVELAPCYEPRGIEGALDRIRGRIDALLVPFDRLTATPRAIDVITGWALRNRIPTAAPQPDWVRHGALFSYGAPLERIGEEASGMASQILAQTRQPADFDLRVPGNLLLSVNRTTAAALGVTLPSDLTFDVIY